jgi:hypothetical protein
MILFEKYGQHQPLNRQAERYSREGVPLSLSTLADQVGACCAALRPLHDRLVAHVLAAERLHGDDTTVPVLAKGKTVTGRCWTYVRDDRPFGGRAPPAAMFFYSRDRSGEHPRQHVAAWTGVLQADAYGGYGKLYDVARQPGPILEAACWAHARRKFFVLADIEANARRKAAPRLRSSAHRPRSVRRIDALFGRALHQRAAGQSAILSLNVALLVAALEAWMSEERRKLSRHSTSPSPWITLKRGTPSPARRRQDLSTNNAAERALRRLSERPGCRLRPGGASAPPSSTASSSQPS